MKRIILFCCAAIMAQGIIGTAFGMEEAVITGIKGNAQIIRNGQSVPVKVSELCQRGDIIKTEDNGAVDISINNMVGYRVLASSESTVVNANEQDMQMKINRGRIIANIEKLSKTSKFRVETPTAIAAVRGTQFSGNVDFKIPNNPDTTFAVREGILQVEALATHETFTVGEGMALDIPHDLMGNLAPRNAFGTELASLEQASTVRTCS